MAMGEEWSSLERVALRYTYVGVLALGIVLVARWRPRQLQNGRGRGHWR